MKARARRVRPLFRHTPCLMAALLACAWPAQRARARDPGERAPADASTRDVVLDVASSERFDAESEATLRELLARLGLRLVRSEPPAQATVVAYVRVQAAGRGALVIVSDGRGRVAPVRREVPPAATRTLFRETLAHVILGAVEPLAAEEPEPAHARGGAQPAAAGSSMAVPESARAADTSAAVAASAAAPASDSSSRPGVSADDDAAVAPAPDAPSARPSAAQPGRRPDPSAARETSSLDPERAPSQRRPDSWTLSIGARGAGVVLASTRVSARFGGAGALVFPARFAPALALDAGYTLPVHIRGGGVRADFSLVSLRGYARMEPYRRARWALRAALGGGVDVVTMAPTWSVPGLLPVNRTRRVHPMLGGALGVRIGRPAKFAFIFDLGFDVDCGPASWTVPQQDRGAERTATFFEPARVRPYATLGVDWSWSRAPRRAQQAEAP